MLGQSRFVYFHNEMRFEDLTIGPTALKPDFSVDHRKHHRFPSTTMADDASYAAFLKRANRPTKSTVSSSETTSVDEPTLSKRHPYLPLLNNKLASLSDKTLVTESDSDFIATFISSSSLPSWTDTA